MSPDVYNIIYALINGIIDGKQARKAINRVIERDKRKGGEIKA